MTNYAERTVTESDMSTLRGRIVAAMKERAERDTDWMLADLADAVIGALQLKPLDEHYNAASTRYVTGWIDNG